MEDARARIAAARGTMARLNRVWRGSEISSVVAIQECQIFTNKCLRRICRVFWPRKIRNEDLWRLTGLRQICSVVESRRWAWVGHQIRRGGGTILALKWTPVGQRRPGRPTQNLRRHMQDTLSTNGMSWGQAEELAKDRVRWRNFCTNL